MTLLSLTDLRTAVRGLRRAPTVTISAVLCLALGLGATAAISSAVDRALLKPLPFRDSNALVTVYRTTPQFNTGPFSAPNYRDIARSSHRLEAMAAMTPDAALVSVGGEAVQATRFRLTGNLFSMLGVAPVHGRLLGESDDTGNQNAVVMLSEEFWRQRFGGDASLVNRTIQLDGEATTVIGILPRGFRVPHGNQMLHSDVWVPIRFSASELNSRGSNYLMVLGRLAAGATTDNAQAELISFFNSLIEQYPQFRGESVRIVSLHADARNGVRAPLLLLFGAVCMVLLIAATNVASLLLARGVQRQREMAVRAALGASRWSVMRPVLTESVLLAGLGVALGIGLAWLGVRTIGALAAQRMPQLDGLTMDLRVVAFAIALSVVVAVLCGAVPAWRGTTIDPQSALRGGRGGGAGRGHHRALGALVVAEVALSLVLLIGAGLVLKGFTRLLHNDPGFDPQPILTLEATISPQNYPGASSVQRFLQPALAAIRQLPGIESAGAISLMPYRNWGWNFNIRYEGQPADNPTQHPLVENRVVTPGFFDVTRQRLISGRLLRDADDGRPGAQAVVLANEALVKRDFHGADPVGKRFYTGGTALATIVGVVSDIKNAGPVSVPQPEVYWTYRYASATSGSGSSGFNVLVRVRSGDPLAVASSVRTAIRSVDRGVAVTQVMPMPDVIAASVGRPRFLFSLLGVFAAVAVALAVAGLYGVMSYAVAQRTRELGIRAALGSTPALTVRLVARQGMMLVAAGAVAGLAGGVGITRLMRSMLYGVSPLDAPIWVLATLLLLAAGLLAALVPSLRAMRVDPVIAIRTE